jgi:hypothetical protein
MGRRVLPRSIWLEHIHEIDRSGARFIGRGIAACWAKPDFRTSRLGMNGPGGEGEDKSGRNQNTKEARELHDTPYVL